MTCVIGLEHEGSVYIGADSAAVNNVAMYQTNIEKVFRADQFLFGFTHSFRMGQILRYHLTVPIQTTDQDDMEYMVVSVIEAVHDCLVKYGFDRGGENSGGTFLIGYHGKIYTVYSDYQVQHHARPFSAIGSGDALALGAMAALDGLSPKKRLLKALNIVGSMSDSVQGPYHVLKL